MSELAEAALNVSLKEIIAEKLAVEEEVPYLTPEGWLRASNFAFLCPREETLAGVRKETRIQKISADLSLIFQHGHALHHQLQNAILPTVGVLRGKWICTACGVMQGGPVPEGAPVRTWAIPRPEACEDCQQEDFLFHEHHFVNHEYRIRGHCDGVLEMKGLPGLGVLEGKSIGPGWEVINVPKLDHVVQLQLYLWLSDLEWGYILYWQKRENGMHALVEHFVERDEETIDIIKSNIRGIWDGLAGGELPERLCMTSDCPRAKACAMRKPCFGLEE